MSRLLLAITLIGVLFTTANADFRTVNRAYEAQLSGITLPVTENGSIGFRKCAECEPVTLSVTTRTTYHVNGENVSLQEFRRAVLQVRDRRGRVAIVKHDIESDVVTAVSIRL